MIETERNKNKTEGILGEFNELATVSLSKQTVRLSVTTEDS